jgi:hypothetical protein
MSPEAQWSLNTFKSLQEGGGWAVPRSGLIFRKRGDTMVLTNVMPHAADMPITAKQLREQQQSELRVITRYFGEAGIEVIARCEI